MNKLSSKIMNLTKMSFPKIIYKYLTMISTIIFVISFTGITLIDPKYIHLLSTIIYLYVGIILVIRFNPYISVHLSKKEKAYDRRMAYSAGILLILSTTVSDFLQDYFKEQIHKILPF